VPDTERTLDDEAANACGLQGRNQVPRALRKDVGGPASGGEGDAQDRYSGILASGGRVACEGANGMPSSQRLRYEFPPLRAGGADDEDFHDPKPIPPQKKSPSN